jgi:hypothetical protein
MKHAVCLLGVILGMTSAGATEVHFCWQGAAGYMIVGRMGFPDQLATVARISEADVTSFDIIGYRNGVAVGQWSLADLRPETSWNLNFLPRDMAFATGGDSFSEMGQQWNSNGSADDCGVAGFGFNIGSFAQDICINGNWVAEAGIAFDTPFPVLPLDEPIDCDEEQVLSLLSIP